MAVDTGDVIAAYAALLSTALALPKLTGWAARRREANEVNVRVAGVVDPKMRVGGWRLTVRVVNDARLTSVEVMRVGWRSVDDMSGIPSTGYSDKDGASAALHPGGSYSGQLLVKRDVRRVRPYAELADGRTVEGDTIDLPVPPRLS